MITHERGLKMSEESDDVVLVRKYEHEVTISDDDIVVIPEDQDFMFQSCCNCGLWHKIHIIRANNIEVRFRFENLGLTDIDITEHGVDRVETYIER